MNLLQPESTVNSLRSELKNMFPFIKKKWNLPGKVKLSWDVQDSFSNHGIIAKDKTRTWAKLPEIAKKVVLQSLPVNAWLLWRFVLQSHQFWLGIKSQKKKKKAELLKAISSQLFASSVAQLCHAQYKHPKTLRKRGKLTNNLEGKNVFSFIVQIKSHVVL